MANEFTLQGLPGADSDTSVATLVDKGFAVEQRVGEKRYFISHAAKDKVTEESPPVKQTDSKHIPISCDDEEFYMRVADTDISLEDLGYLGAIARIIRQNLPGDDSSIAFDQMRKQVVCDGYSTASFEVAVDRLTAINFAKVANLGGVLWLSITTHGREQLQKGQEAAAVWKSVRSNPVPPDAPLVTIAKVNVMGCVVFADEIPAFRKALEHYIDLHANMPARSCLGSLAYNTNVGGIVIPSKEMAKTILDQLNFHKV